MYTEPNGNVCCYLPLYSMNTYLHTILFTLLFVGLSVGQCEYTTIWSNHLIAKEEVLEHNLHELLLINRKVTNGFIYYFYFGVTIPLCFNTNVGLRHNRYHSVHRTIFQRKYFNNTSIPFHSHKNRSGLSTKIFENFRDVIGNTLHFTH